MMALGLAVTVALTAGAAWFGLLSELFSILIPAFGLGAVIGLVGFFLPD